MPEYWTEQDARKFADEFCILHFGWFPRGPSTMITDRWLEVLLAAYEQGHRDERAEK